jgi:hypothetical protein
MHKHHCNHNVFVPVPGPIGSTGPTGSAVTGTPLNIPDTLVERDGTGSFAAQSVTLYGNLILVQDPSTASAGVIYKGTIPFIHDAGSQNMFAGLDAGNLGITGNNNSGFGYQSLLFLTSGNGNTAAGSNALQLNTVGSGNTAIGNFTLSNNTSGNSNVALGDSALNLNNGNTNIAIGTDAMANAVGVDNDIAIGYQSLLVDTSGYNVAIGFQSMLNSSTASDNTALGAYTLQNDQFGGNIAIGPSALNATVNATNNIAIGTNALLNTLNSDNIAIGNQSGATITTGTDNIYINADAATSAESDTIRIGTNQTTCYVAGITGVTTVNPAVPVYVATDGQLGINSSLRSVKENIKDIDANTNRDIIKNFIPRTFNYIADKHKHQQYGFIVEEVHPSLVHHDAKGNPQTIYYQHIPILLTKEIQRLGDLTDQLTAQLNEQRKTIEELTAWKNRTKNNIVQHTFIK